MASQDDSFEQVRRKRGMVAMLITDRDAELVPKVMECLNVALEPIINHQSSPITMDLIVSLRAQDSIAKSAITRHIPKAIRSCRFLICDYDAQWENAKLHTDDILEAICMQRNLLISCARYGRYGFIFFLDSDIYLRPDSLEKLYNASDNEENPVVVIPYQPRWSAHVTLGVRQSSEQALESKETSLQFLVNPELLENEHPKNLAPIAVAGLGCAIIRSSAFKVEFIVEMSTGGVKGEDIGYCESLRASGIIPKVITGTFVEHEAGGKAKSLFIPFIDDTSPMITHVKVHQLSWVETASKITWYPSETAPGDPCDLMGNVIWVQKVKTLNDFYC